jgi:predicted nicotinamide N-methyase
VVVGGRVLRVLAPVDPDRLLDAPEVRERNAREDFMPYWAYLWPSAVRLAEEVLGRAWPAGARAIELGCGLGLGGLAALAAGLDVTFTDHDAAALGHAAASAQANGFDAARWRVGMLDWREVPVGERYDVVLGSDLLYERRLVPLVAGVVAALLADGGTMLVTGPDRAASEEFPAELERRGLVVGVEEVGMVDLKGRALRGFVWRGGWG